MRPVARWLALCALCAFANVGYSAATFQFRFQDGAGEGANDSTPFTPEGGNNATTLGEARRNVLAEAGRIWGTLLTSSVPIIVDVFVDPLACTLNSATLATAGTTFIYRNPNGPQPNVLLTSALIDAQLGTNVSEGSPSTANSADIRVTVNLTLQNDPNCFQGSRFYYGFDHLNGFNQPDLLQVLLHEIAHGLGFASFVNLNTGNGLTGGDGVERFGSYDQFIFDEFLNQSWVSLTAQQRLQSAVRTGFLAWTGTNANKWRHRYSAGVTANGRLQLYAPATISTGSSVSHWDTALAPNALMEPFRTPTTNNFTDLTTCVLRDMGWTVANCIDGANAIPVAQAFTATVLEDTPTNIVLTGTDADGDPLTYALAGTPAKGTLSALSTVPPPSTMYSPTLNANGADSFTFTVTDDSSTSLAGTVTVNITPVNDPPAAVAKTASVQSGSSVGITLTGTDIDGDALTFTVVNGPGSGTVSGSPPNVTYTPSSGFTGADSFTYRANDATLSSAAVAVSITVTAAPPNTGGGGGGGGAMGLPLLALLGGLLARRLRAARLS
jgi:hypothetical protein